MERAALVNTPSLRKRAVSRGMAGGLGFDGAETLVLPPLDLALMAATLRRPRNPGRGGARYRAHRDGRGARRDGVARGWQARVPRRQPDRGPRRPAPPRARPPAERPLCLPAARRAGGHAADEPRLPLPVRLLLPLPPRRGQGVARAVAGARLRGASRRRRTPRRPQDLLPRRHLHPRSEAD